MSQKINMQSFSEDLEARLKTQPKQKLLVETENKAGDRRKLVRHGMHDSDTYVSWEAMKQRCYNKNHISYPGYGGRGIRVCERWHDFKAFLEEYFGRSVDSRIYFGGGCYQGDKPVASSTAGKWEEKEMKTKAEVARLDWRTLFREKKDTPVELVKLLDDYFSVFAQPPFVVEEDGKADLGKFPCLKCKMPLVGDFTDWLLSDGQSVWVSDGGFVWGLVHGEGYCKKCKWPARAHHFVKDGEGKEVLAIRNLVLQYHPDVVGRKRK